MKFETSTRPSAVALRATSLSSPSRPALSSTVALKIQPVGGRLILQEGEVSGHHHAITLPVMDRPRKENAEVERLMADAIAGRIAVPTARLYRDPAAANAMMRAGILERTDLCIAFLLIEHGPMVLSHEEHGGIRIPVGAYYVGSQIESAGAEERRVVD